MIAMPYKLQKVIRPFFFVLTFGVFCGFNTESNAQSPKVLDEKVARLHLDKLSVELTELKEDQADSRYARPSVPPPDTAVMLTQASDAGVHAHPLRHLVHRQHVLCR